MVRTGRGSTVKDPLGGSTDKERRGVTHYSYGEGSLASYSITTHQDLHLRGASSFIVGGASSHAVTYSLSWSAFIIYVITSKECISLVCNQTRSGGLALLRARNVVLA